MAHYTESEATYCSEVEKEDQNRIRRSKRLSQKYMRCSFRSNEDLHIQRLNDIYRMLKCGMLCSTWALDDWKALKFEVDLIKKTLKGKPYSNKFSFISKKIDENLQYSRPTSRNEPSIESQNVEPEKSPNILAGMMSEVLTEIPPYQAKDFPNVIKAVPRSKSSVELTQKDALDLTKKNIQIPTGLHKESSQNITKRNKPQTNDITVIAEVITTQQETTTPPQTEVSLSSKEPTIDLTEEVSDERDFENIAPVMESRTRKSKSPVHVSKWLQYLPTQDRPTFNIEKPKVVATKNPNNHPKSIKDSIIKLYKDQPTGSGIQNNKQNPNTGGYPKNHKQQEKSNSATNRSRIIENFKPKPLRNTQNISRQETEFTPIAPRNIQSEQFCSRSPDFLLEEFLKYTTPDANDIDKDSVESFSPSLKDSFKEVFGTDSFREVFGCEEVVYNLKESHVKRLAKAINVEHGTLKKTIKKILLDDSCGVPEDDVMRSDSSVIECSQSPPQRLFSSQRSQVSK